MCGEVGYNIDGGIAREERCPHVENEDVPHPPVGAQTRLAVDRYGEHSSVWKLPFMMASTSTECARRQLPRHPHVSARPLRCECREVRLPAPPLRSCRKDRPTHVRLD